MSDMTNYEEINDFVQDDTFVNEDTTTSLFDFSLIEDDDGVDKLEGSEFKEQIEAEKAKIEQESDEYEAEQIESISQLANKFDEIPDEIEFSIGDQKVTKADLVEAIKAKEEVSSKSSELMEYYRGIEERNKILQTQFKMAQTEVEKTYEALSRKLQSNALSPMERGQIYDKLESLKIRHNELHQIAVQTQEDIAQQFEEKAAFAFNQFNNTYGKTIPGWNGVQSLAELGDYARSIGIDTDDIAKNISPAYILLLHKAKKLDDFEKGKQSQMKEKISRVATSSTSKAKAPVSQSNGQKVALVKKLEKQGAVGAKDAQAMFYMLED